MKMKFRIVAKNIWKKTNSGQYTLQPRFFPEMQKKNIFGFNRWCPIGYMGKEGWHSKESAEKACLECAGAGVIKEFEA